MRTTLILSAEAISKPPDSPALSPACQMPNRSADRQHAARLRQMNGAEALVACLLERVRRHRRRALRIRDCRGIEAQYLRGSNHLGRPRSVCTSTHCMLRLVRIVECCASLCFSFSPAPRCRRGPSFRNHVQPILARYGCSIGRVPRRGGGPGRVPALAARLRRRGRLPHDHPLGARAGASTLDDPARSLFLLKATKLVPHKGGERFKADSPEYQDPRRLDRQRRAGAAGEGSAHRAHRGLAAARRRSKPGQTQPIKVTAFFNDGQQRGRDALGEIHRGQHQSSPRWTTTAWSKVTGHGEGTVTAWYLSQLAIATVTVPYRAAASLAQAFAAFQPRNFIDERVLEKLRELNLPPSARCTDAEFIRRAFLDTIGVLPTPDETRAFLAETNAGQARPAHRRRCSQRPEFVDYWAYKWSDLLLVNSDKLPVQPMWSYYQWIRRQRGAEHAVGRDGARPPHRHRQHAGERRGQFLRPARRTDAARRDRLRRLPRHVDQLREVPQPPDGEVDERPVLTPSPISSPACASKNGAVADERVIFADTDGRPRAAAHRQAAAADAARRRSRSRSTSPEDRRVAARELADRAGESRTSPAPSPTACGRTSSPSASSRRWTTCA